MQLSFWYNDLIFFSFHFPKKLDLVLQIRVRIMALVFKMKTTWFTATAHLNFKEKDANQVNNYR